ncbi:hypothetical protein [Ktedonospora formicarum]|uniref:Transposase n=1 Tax=Ktedonospora formicarum TaxID=2778364 RepID=A0A8J3MXF0_9CHLR|nr:hypothetical protein [Ktedonospora formicarum]GHO49678.1 hypothetical protein KSX_78410 [Ktedonospora formicarum]
MQVTVSLTLEVNANASLTQMEEQVQQAGQRWTRSTLKDVVGVWEHAHRGCPRCGSTQVRTEGTTGRNIQTLFGPVYLARRRFRCQRCHQRWCPCKRLLSTLHQARVTQPLREAAIMVGASWPYRQAAGCLKRLTGAQISAEEIRLLTNEQGKIVAHHQAQQAESATLLPSTPPAQPQEEQQRCVIGLDGGWICNRDKRGGMEGKVGVIASGKNGAPCHHSPTQP